MSLSGSCEMYQSPGQWQRETRIRNWSFPSSPDGGCRVMFISILDSASSDIVTFDTQKKDVNFCGNNPGTFISSGSGLKYDRVLSSATSRIRSEWRNDAIVAANIQCTVCLHRSEISRVCCEYHVFLILCHYFNISSLTLT